MLDWLGAPPPEWFVWLITVGCSLILVAIIRRRLVVLGVVISLGLLALSSSGVLPALPGM